MEVVAVQTQGCPSSTRTRQRACVHSQITRACHPRSARLLHGTTATSSGLQRAVLHLLPRPGGSPWTRRGGHPHGGPILTPLPRALE